MIEGNKRPYEKGEIVMEPDTMRKVRVEAYLPDQNGYLGRFIINSVVEDQWGDPELDDDGNEMWETFDSHRIEFFPNLVRVTEFLQVQNAQVFKQLNNDYIKQTIARRREELAELDEELKQTRELRQQLSSRKHQHKLINLLLNFVDGVDLWVGSWGSYTPFICRLSELKAHGITYENVERMVYLSAVDTKHRNLHESTFEWRISNYNDSSGSSATTAQVALTKDELMGEMFDQMVTESKRRNNYNVNNLVKGYDMLVEAGGTPPEELTTYVNDYKSAQSEKEKQEVRSRAERLAKELKELEGKL